MWISHLCELSPSLLPPMLDTACKGVAILLLTSLVTLAMRRASAAGRHLVWFLGSLSLLILPILSTALPAWYILPRWTVNHSVETKSPQPAVVTPPVQTAAPSVAAPLDTHDTHDTHDTQLLPNYTPSSASPMMAPPPTAVPITPFAPIAPLPAEASARINWPAWIVLTWATGTVLLLVYMLVGCLSLWRLQRRSARLSTGVWRIFFDQACAVIGFRRPVTLLCSPRRSMPMTWGFWRTWILVPEDARNWTPEQRRAVLLHELAHARRFDCLTQLVSYIACAVYWFNPLIWLAWRGMQSEREQACDDLVLSTGTRASAYAEHLLQIAAEMPPVRFSAAAIAMARPSTLEGRLLAILDVKRNRRALTWGGVIAAVLVIAAFAVPLSILRAAEPKSASDSKAIEPKENPEKQKPEPLPLGSAAVVDVQGKPVPGAKVSNKKTGWSATTDAEGLFSFARLSSGEAQNLKVTASGFVTRNNAVFQPNMMDGASSSNIIELHRPGRLEGRLLGPDGKPLAGAPVSTIITESYKSSLINTDQDVRPLTDVQGRFVLEDVPPGEVVLSYPKIGATPVEKIPALPITDTGTVLQATLDDGGFVRGLVLDLSQSIGVVEGCVIDSEGKPLGGVKVDLRCRVWSGVSFDLTVPTLTDNQGRYTLTHLPMGDWRIACSVGMAAADLPVNVSPTPARMPDVVLPVIQTARGRLRRVPPMDAYATAQEWIDATLADDAEGVQAVVVPQSFAARCGKRLAPLLAQIKSFPSGRFVESSTELTSDEIDLGGRRGTMTFKLINISEHQSLLSDVVAENGVSWLRDPEGNEATRSGNSIPLFELTPKADRYVKEVDGNPTVTFVHSMDPAQFDFAAMAWDASGKMHESWGSRTIPADADEKIFLRAQADGDQSKPHKTTITFHDLRLANIRRIDVIAIPHDASANFTWSTFPTVILNPAMAVSAAGFDRASSQSRDGCEVIALPSGLSIETHNSSYGSNAEGRVTQMTFSAATVKSPAGVTILEAPSIEFTPATPLDMTQLPPDNSPATQLAAVPPAPADSSIRPTTHRPTIPAVMPVPATRPAAAVATAP